MHASQLSQSLREIVDIIKRKSASNSSAAMETILLDYGDEKNLAPAQLEKLAQSLNSTLAIAHNKGAADKGSTFDIVDTPVLLERFTATERKPAKAAGVKQAATQNVPAEWQSFSVGSHFSNTGAERPPFDWDKVDQHFTNGDARSIGGWHKAAASVEGRYGSLEDRQVSEADMENLKRLADSAFDSAYSGMLKLARKVRGNPGMYSEVVQDMVPYTANHAAVAGLLDTCLKNLGSPARYKVAAETRDFLTDRHNIGEMAKQAGDLLEEREACLALRSEIKEAAPRVKARVDDEEENAPPAGGGGFLSSLQNQPSSNQAPPDDDRSKGKGKEPSHGPGQRYVEQHEGKPEGSWADSFLALTEGSGDLAGTAGRTAKGLTQAITDSNVQGTARNTAEGYGAIFGHGREQAMQRMNSRLRAWRQGAVLQRLMLSDDVLSRLNPADVASAFDTIRRANPGMAEDVNSVRIPLREALQYQGVPLNTLKTLKDIDRPAKEPNQNSDSKSKSRS